MKYSEAIDLLNRKSVKIAIKMSDFLRNLKKKIPKIPRDSHIDNNYEYEPNADPVRTWSNIELKKFTKLFGGDIANISGWEDKDKDGGYYKDYFPKAKSYTITNYSQHLPDRKNEIELDLEDDLRKELIDNFDVVFNHTVLEHIFDARKAFKNLASMSRDIVITVVPFIQQQHEIEGFKDYWRYTPSALRRLAQENDMEIIYENYRRDPYEITYIVSVASKNPTKWRNKMPNHEELRQICDWIG